MIIAGGSGTRLWPLSTPSYPKHLLKVDGDDSSLLQHAYGRARQLTKDIYVVSEAGHSTHVREQLPALAAENFIIEPARRGTASCILAALVRIAAEHGPDEPIAFLAADQYVRDVSGFVHSFEIAADTSRQTGRIVLVGVEPDYPATGFGYIQKNTLLDDDDCYMYTVRAFKEKPDYNTAQEYVRSGNYLWNCGYFVGSVGTFEAAMRVHTPGLFAQYRELAQAAPDEYDRVYLSLDTISIDYALMEKTRDLLVVPASFDWMDLGSFADMYKAVDRNEQGNHLLGNVETEEVENAFIQNHEAKPLAVIGLDNVVVVNTPAGILVARKDISQKVGDVSKRFATEGKTGKHP